MKHPFSRKAVQILLAIMLVITVFHLSSPILMKAQNNGVTLVIVGSTEEESPVSGIELEIFEQTETGELGKKIGNFVSQKTETGEGHIYLDVPKGDYKYRVLTKEYELPEKEEWQVMSLSGEQEVILVWVSPSTDEETIKDEPIAQGAPQVEKTENTGPQGNFEEGKVGSHEKGKLRELQFEKSKNVWITLGVLAALIFGIIAIDFFANSKK